MTNEQLADEMDALALQISSTAAKLEYYGGLDWDAQRRARSFSSLSDMIRFWSKSLRAAKPLSEQTKTETCPATIPKHTPDLPD